MSKQTTALLMFGPTSIAPWGDRVWRVAATAQLVEGSAPYWIFTPTEPAETAASPQMVEVAAPNPEAVVESILMMAAAWFGDSKVENCLIETHNLTMNEGVRELAPFYELAESTQHFLARHLSGNIRLGATRLDEQTLLSAEVVRGLRLLGFDFDTFDLSSSTSV